MSSYLPLVFVAVTCFSCIVAPPTTDPSTSDTGSSAPDAPDAPQGDAMSGDACTTSAYRAPLVIPGDKVLASVEGLAVPIRLTTAQFPELATPGSRAWFTDEEGEPLPSETSLSSEQGLLHAWVQWPALEPRAESKIWLHVGPSETAPLALAMWNDYSGVWHFEADALLKDSSPNGNHGASGSLSLDDLTEGVVGTALRFSGDDVVTVGDDESIRSQSFTLMTWISNVESTSPTMLMSKKYVARGQMSFGYGITAAGAVYGFATPEDSEVSTHTFPSEQGEVPFGAWHQVVMTRTETERVRLYVDGEPIHDQAFTQAIGYDEGELTIGNRLGDSQYVVGTLDEVAVLPAAMNDNWIAMTYAAQADAEFVQIGALEANAESCE